MMIYLNMMLDPEKERLSDGAFGIDDADYKK